MDCSRNWRKPGWLIIAYGWSIKIENPVPRITSWILGRAEVQPHWRISPEWDEWHSLLTDTSRPTRFLPQTNASAQLHLCLWYWVRASRHRPMGCCWSSHPQRWFRTPGITYPKPGIGSTCLMRTVPNRSRLSIKSWSRIYPAQCQTHYVYQLYTAQLPQNHARSCRTANAHTTCNAAYDAAGMRNVSMFPTKPVRTHLVNRMLDLKKVCKFVIRPTLSDSKLSWNMNGIETRKEGSWHWKDGTLRLQWLASTFGKIRRVVIGWRQSICWAEVMFWVKKFITQTILSGYVQIPKFQSTRETTKDDKYKVSSKPLLAAFVRRTYR